MAKVSMPCPVVPMSEDDEMRAMVEAQHVNPFKVALLDPEGREIPDPVSLVQEVSWRDPPNIEATIQSFLAEQRIREALHEQGQETFEEADDFEVGDDFDPTSPYEGDFETPLADLAKAMQERLYGPQGGEKPPVPAGGPPAASPPVGSPEGSTDPQK